jgi:hypothetical protein
LSVRERTRILRVSGSGLASVPGNGQDTRPLRGCSNLLDHATEATSF